MSNDLYYLIIYFLLSLCFDNGYYLTDTIVT